ncbi:squalene/phytoene synthase family protein [Akkermansiaceae bacterium]|nr:squalene/phytoene synthase family protein [Akkermansiaceae bacterium]MDB4272079.1 squalene/phytoene synthase family protein [bacterium]MDA8992106.1 squalene/phytoene synthase family protein [Akkermansiaceae bacterium]MDB4141834.1 squalene/phytoene synthase family protein [Akkermansiaceae bacterium]MDB4259983.1 squalene/phytoene synthase family protein [Akkermansiaceae bacterium]
MAPDPTSAEITSKAKSNLAFALRCVPAERRGHLISFYAYCRVIDDLADDLDLTLEKKTAGLAGWKNIFSTSEPDPSLGLVDLQKEVLAVRDLYSIPSEYFVNVIEGCEMDLHPQRFETWGDLQGYCYRVASSVGLVCLPLFGADIKRSKDYAIALGYALQLTNILRDIGEDLENGNRIYLPLAELKEFGISEEDLIEHRHDDRFKKFMIFQAERAQSLYRKASELLPKEDFKPLLAPRVMHKIYQTLLVQMQGDNYQVFTQRYRLSKLQKITLLIKERFAKRP